MAEPGARARRGGRIIGLYLVRGTAGPFLAITLGACLAMMLERALRVMQALAESGADIAFFPAMMVELVPYYLNLALPAAFMAALVLLVARLDDNLELEAMLAGGLSLGRIAAPLALFGVLIGLASLAVGGWLEPVGRHGFNSLKAAAVNSGRIGGLQPRALYHPAEGLAFTFDRRAGDGSVRGAFVWQRTQDGTELALTGTEARIGVAPGERRFAIRLAGGRYAAERPGAAPVTLVFDRLEIGDSLLLEEAVWARGWSQKELTLGELIAGLGHPHPRISEAEYRTEIYSRVVRAASIPLIPFLVLPLAFATKNGRRALGILLGGVFLAGFHHAINFARQPALAGTVSPEAAIGGVAGVGTLLVLLIFWSGRHLPSRSPIASALKPLGDALARLKPREGHRRRPGGRTLAAYIAWRLGKWAVIAAIAIVLLLQLVDLVERGEEFAARQMGAADVAHYVWLRLPPMLHQAIPIAALAGAMAAFIGLRRSREMVAIRAAGLSQYRVLAMALPVPVLLAASSWLLAEHAVPTSQARLAAWWAATDPAPRTAEASARWFRIGGEFVRARAATPGGARLEGVDIFRRDGSGLLIERVFATAAVQTGDRWSLTGVERTRFEANRAMRERVARMDWATPLRASDVAVFFAAAPVLSADAARRSLAAEAPVSRGGALFTTRLQRAWAEPLAPLVMLLLALPLAFAAERRAGWPALLYAGGGGLLYLTMDGALTVAGQVGALPPVVAAWLAPALFILGGLTVLVYWER
jgi:lipopolysaccharide export system permease protein